VSELDAARWRQLRQVFADLVELPPVEREQRLADLPPEDAARVRDLLAAAATDTNKLLGEGAIGAVAAAVLADLGGLAGDDDGEGDQPAVAGTLLGPWRLERPLGRGGMAEVWEAGRVDGQYEQTVAVKVLKRGMDSAEIVRRFLRERQILARLDHPGIARLFDGGLGPDGRPYFVLERVEGEPITDWCARRELDVPARLRLLVAACEAVSAAHRQLVVHRDLKPSNILVTGDGAVKLLDFGIAKVLADDEGAGQTTRAEVRVLTPAYAAPEQILGEPVSTATDVYALGVLAYELLTGRLPHQRGGRRAAELASAVAGESIARPSTAVLETAAGTAGDGEQTRQRRRLARTLAGDLDTVVMTALRREPERRYPSVAAFADDILRFLDGRPVAARPDSAGYRAPTFIARNRVAVAAAALAALALVAGLLTALAQARRAERAARLADAAALAARAEAEESAAIADFLTDVFTAADPEGKRAAERTAAELVQRGAERIDEKLARQPATRAALLHVLGDVELRLGLYEPAQELLEKALALRRALAPPAPAEVAASAATLGITYHRRGRSADALPLLAEAFAYHQRSDPGGLEVVSDLSNLANAYKALHRDAEARAAFERAVALLERQPDADPSLFARVLNNYGLFLDRNVRDRAGAKVALERALALHERNSGPNSALVSGTLGNLSELYIRLGEVDRAVAASRRAVGISEATYGPRHYELALAKNQLGWALLAAGRAAEARPVLAESQAVVTEAVGERHRSTGYVYRNLGQALAATGEPRQAIAAFRRAESAWLASLGAEAPELGTVYIQLAPLLGGVEGERLLERTIEVWRRDGTRHGRLREAWVALASARLARCDLPAAREALAAARREAETDARPRWAPDLAVVEKQAAVGTCGA
jgi:serine/threonine-protein kinase